MNSINYQSVIVKHSDYLPFQEIPLKIKFAVYNCFAKSAFSIDTDVLRRNILLIANTLALLIIILKAYLLTFVTSCK